MHHHGGGAEERLSQRGIPCLGDPSDDIALSGLLAPGYWPAEASRALGDPDDFGAWPVQHRDWLARRQRALGRLAAET